MTEHVDRNVQRLLHMLETVKRAQRTVSGMSREEFLSDERTQDALSFDIATFGEAAAHVTDDFKAAHPEIPWDSMRGMRNRLVHAFDYGQIDYAIVWEVATDSLPKVAPDIRAALETIELPPDFSLPEL